MTSGPVAAADEADVVAAAVLDCPAVASLYGGGPVPVVTLLPGRRIDGVHLDEDRVRVAVVAAFGVPLIGMEEQVRAAVAPLVGGRPVDIHVADLQLPEEQPPALPAGPVNHAGVLRDG